jgi:hypothetical protein
VNDHEHIKGDDGRCVFCDKTQTQWFTEWAVAEARRKNAETIQQWRLTSERPFPITLWLFQRIWAWLYMLLRNFLAHK